MPYSGQSGQYGSIPYADLRNKYEVTSMGDSAPAALYEEMRSGLRDMSCSTTFFESDHKREDNHSETFLSLRHTGHRTGETPDAPDLFLELTGRDPRGTSTDPNMRLMADQAWSRRDRHRFFSDSDHSITEREKRPQVLIAQLREQFELIKQRLKIFSTSREGQSTNLGQKRQGDRATTDAQAGISERDEVLAAIRQQSISGNANMLSLGWEQTGDARFKVAALGQLRAGQRQTDGLAVRADQQGSQRATRSQQQTVKTGTANMMRIVMDRMNEGRRNEHDGDQQLIDGRSRTNTCSRFVPGDTSAVASTGVATQDAVRAFGTVERFIGQLRAQSGMQGQDIETQLQIVQFMDNAVQASRLSSEARYKAEDIVLSAAMSRGFEEAFRAAGNVNQDPAAARRNTGQTARYSESAAVAQLGRRTGDSGAPRFARSGEGYKAQSRETVQKRLRGPDDMDDLSRAAAYDGTQDVQTFMTADRHVRGLGTKFTRDRMDTERTLDAISENN
jgi:hypothetical protein